MSIAKREGSGRVYILAGTLDEGNGETLTAGLIFVQPGTRIREVTMRSLDGKNKGQIRLALADEMLSLDQHAYWTNETLEVISRG